MGDPFRCGRCDTWFDYYEALEDHIAKEHPTPSDKSVLAFTQYELKEALLEIRRHHADFKKVQAILDSIEEKNLPPEAFEEYAMQALKDIRNIVG